MSTLPVGTLPLPVRAAGARGVVAALLACALLGPAASAQHFGDMDADGDVDAGDAAAFAACASGPGTATPLGNCWVADADLDVDVDLEDYEALQLAAGAPPTGFSRAVGRYQGTAKTPDGSTHQADVLLAQWGHRIWGMVEVFVTPGDPLNGIPAARLTGSIHDDTLVLGMSGQITNMCLGEDHSTDADVLTVAFLPASQRLVVTDLVEYLPVGCPQLLTEINVHRIDDDWVPGNTDVLGTWLGETFAPSGHVFAPIPSFHPRMSFFLDPGLVGYVNFGLTTTWGFMGPLIWDPETGLVEYTWLCLPSFRYRAFVDGNKLSGRWGSVGSADEDYVGVMVHDLQEVFVPPSPIAPCP